MLAAILLHAVQAAVWATVYVATDHVAALLIAGSSALFVYGLIAVCAVTVCIWMYRIAVNSKAFKPKLTFPPVLAVFGWLLFPGFWIVPALQLNELWSVNTPPGARVGRRWMIWAWLVCGPLAVLTLMTVSTEGSEPAVLYFMIGFGGMLPVLIAAVLFIFIIREITSRQKARQALVVEGYEMTP